MEFVIHLRKVAHTVSTEVATNGRILTWESDPGPLVGSGVVGFDPVLYTASDRPDAPSIPSMIDPAADHLDPALTARRAQVEENHRRIVAWLDTNDYHGVTLARADSIAWFTAGGDLGQNLGGDGASVAIFVNRGTRAVLADNVQSARVFEEELAGLGFQLKERPWHADDTRIIAELTHNRRVATDAHHPGLIPESTALRALRTPLTPFERDRLRALGRTLTLAVEATCGNFLPGESEADIAGHLAHRLFREGVVPVDLRVAGDDRLARYRQPVFKSAPIERRATITATGRRHGLCASVTRTVAFGPIPQQVQADHTVASMVDATCIYFSRPGEPVAEVLRRARRIYEKSGRPHEWTLDYQGAFIGYAPNEGWLTPDGATVLEPGQAIRWNPSVGSARSEDTIVIDARGFEVVTEAQNWPKINVSVKGFAIDRPGILQR